MKHLEPTPFTWKVKETVKGTQIFAGGGTAVATIHKRDLPKEQKHNAMLLAKSKEMYNLIQELLRYEANQNLELPIIIHPTLQKMDNLFNEYFE